MNSLPLSVPPAINEQTRKQNKTKDVMHAKIVVTILKLLPGDFGLSLM